MSNIKFADPFDKLSVKLTGAPRTYTILHHILLTEFSPRELATLERVSKKWNKVINSDTELWWNTWMELVWGTKNIDSTTTRPKVTENNLKELIFLQKSLSLTEYSSSSNNSSSTELVDDNSSFCSSVTTLTELSTYESGLSGKRTDSVCTLNKSKKLSRAERKRGPKVWKKLAIEEYRKQEVRNVFKSSSNDVESDSDSDVTIVENNQEKSNTKGKLTSEEKLEARSKYKMGKAKPKTKHTWRNESNISREWMAFEYYYD